MIYSTTEFFALLWLTASLLQTVDQRFRRVVLLVASVVFFAWAGWVSFILLSAVTLVLFFAIRLATEVGQRAANLVYLVSGGLIIANLAFWKYWPWISSQLGIGTDWEMTRRVVEIGLPLGISFYTLQGIAYLIDVRNGTAKPASLLDTALFKFFFGQLIAGPIVRYSELMPQVKAPPLANAEDIRHGALLFALGLFKKLVLADRSAQYADPIFSDLDDHSALIVIAGLLLFAVQIWADFSGYTDMGRGAARLCGIHLPENFRSPYLATSPSDFWRRWHITLSRWIRDYLYIPLGGNRAGKARTVMNLMTVMAIGGLWHGAAWNFLFWGLYHGALLSVQHMSRDRIKIPYFLPSAFLMFPLTLFGWLLFRIRSLEELNQFLTALTRISPAQAFHDIGTSWKLFAVTTGLFMVCMLIQFLNEQQKYRFERATLLARNNLLVGIIVGIAVVVSVAFRGVAAPFIYFQF